MGVLNHEKNDINTIDIINVSDNWYSKRSRRDKNK